MKVKVFAPATVANIGCGFDFLGLCLTKIGDEVIVSKIDEPIVKISSSLKSIPIDPNLNTAGKGLLALIKDKKLSFGFKVFLNKKIPIGSGLGGSATGAVGSVLGANYFLENKLSGKELLSYSAIGESATGSSHLDNIAPCLYGGIVGISNDENIIRIRSSFDHIRVLIIHQKVNINTNESRTKLKKEITLLDHTAQSKNLMNLILGLREQNLTYLKNGLDDLIIEPQRKTSIPNFDLIKDSLKNIVIGGSISGSGPTLFFFYEENRELLINSILLQLKANSLIEFDYFFESLNPSGAKIIEVCK